jgi:hypothetical protein
MNDHRSSESTPEKRQPGRSLGRVNEGTNNCGGPPKTAKRQDKGTRHFQSPMEISGNQLAKWRMIDEESY